MRMSRMGALAAPRVIANKDYWIESAEYGNTVAHNFAVSNASFNWLVESKSIIQPQNNSVVKVTKLHKNGNVIWQKLLTDVSNLMASCVEVDSQSNIYIGGMVGNNDNQTRQNAYLNKIDKDGTVLWERKIVGTISSVIQLQFLSSIALDSSGNIFASMVAPTSSTATDINLIKYDENGTVVWNTVIQRSTGNSLVPISLAVDSSSNCYIVSYLFNNSSIFTWTLIKTNSNGTIQWQKSSNDFRIRTQYTGVVKVDSNDDLLIGTSAIISSKFQPTLVKMNSSGSVLSAKSIIDNATTDPVFISILDFDTSDNIYYGNYTLSSPGWNTTISKTDSSFDPIWKRSYTTSVGTNNNITSVALSSRAYLITNGFTIASLPKAGTKTGTYSIGGGGTVTYASVTLPSTSTPTYTLTNTSFSTTTNSNFSSSSYSTTVTTPTYTPTVIYL